MMGVDSDKLRVDCDNEQKTGLTELAPAYVKHFGRAQDWRGFRVS